MVAEFRGEHDLVADGSERLAHQLLVAERAVGLGGVEEGDAALDSRADEGDRFRFVRRWPIALAEAHAAQAEGRDRQFAASECSLLHGVSCHLSGSFGGAASSVSS